jgi:hypothetical protein
MNALNVLVLESERNAGDVARAELAAAGHRTVRCHEPGAPAFPCNAIAPGHACPFDEGVVDVVLDVRPRPRSQPSPIEDGVNCALRRHIPVVVAGPEVLNPYAEFADVLIDTHDDVVRACVRAAGAPLREPTRAAAKVLREVLDRRALSISPVVRVVRRAGGLLIEVAGASDLDEPTKSMAGVRMAGAVRAIDRRARGVDVVFTSHGEG